MFGIATNDGLELFLGEETKQVLVLGLGLGVKDVYSSLP